MGTVLLQNAEMSFNFGAEPFRFPPGVKIFFDPMLFVHVADAHIPVVIDLSVSDAIFLRGIKSDTFKKAVDDTLERFLSVNTVIVKHLFNYCLM